MPWIQQKLAFPERAEVLPKTPRAITKPGASHDFPLEIGSSDEDDDDDVPLVLKRRRQVMEMEQSDDSAEEGHATGQDTSEEETEKNGGLDMSQEEEEEEEEEEESDIDDIDFDEDEDELTIDVVRQLAERDDCVSEDEKRSEAGIDRWVMKYATAHYERASEEAKEMAALVSHVIKPIIAQESKGLFIYKEERLQKAFPFRSSFRDILLQEVNGDQILDLVLAIFLSAASPTLSDSFFQLYEDGVRGTLHLGEVFSEGIPARNAVKEVGLYLRFLPGFDFYCGISRNISQRQRQHNAGIPEKQGNKKMKAALNGRNATECVKAVRMVSMGKTGISECPQPLLHAFETIIVCCARLTTSDNSIQVNIIDSPPFRLPQRPIANSSNQRNGRILANVWERLFEYYRESQADFAKGRYMRLGAKPVPVGTNGTSRADREAKQLILPIIRNEKVGMSFVLANLFRTVTFEKDGEVVEESGYPELRKAKKEFPIPDHAFFQGRDYVRHKAYMDRGVKDITLSSYAPWVNLIGPNGYSVVSKAGKGGGLLGDHRSSNYSEEALDDMRLKCRKLMKGMQVLGLHPT